MSKQKLSVLIALCLVVVVAGVVAYLLVFREPPPGELVKREVAKLERIVEQNPDNPDRRVELALLYSEAGSQQQAIAQLKTALELNESHQGALVALGNVYMGLGRYEDAIELYSRVVELNQDNPMRSVSRQLEAVYYYLGTAYFNLGRSQDAIQSLEEALLIDRTDADAWYMLGATYHHLKEFEKAIQRFEQAVRFVPNFEEAYQGLAQCYEKTGQTEQAAYADAMVTYSSGSPAEAIRKLEIVIANEPNFTKAYLGLGLAYEKKGEIGKAIGAYQKALELEPDLWLAQARLQALGAK